VATYHHGDLRPALLRAAGELLEKHGVESLSLREAARRAGVSHNAPYRHFPNRSSLLAALAAEGFAALREEIGRQAERDKGLAYIEFALERPQRFRLMFGGVVAFDEYPELRAQAEHGYANVQSFASFADEAPLAAAAAWSLVHGLVHLILEGHFAAARAQSGGSAAFAAKVLGSVRLARAQRTA
jgi:AcrR family transcriptional regulator